MVAAKRYVFCFKGIRIDALQVSALLILSRDVIRKVLAIVLGRIGFGFLAVAFADIIIYSSLCLAILMTKQNVARNFCILFICVFAFFFGTWVIYPDYLYWLIRPDLGAVYTVFRPDHGALWAFLAIELSGSPENAWDNIRKYSYLLGLYDLYLAYVAIRSGGLWYSYNASGVMEARTYSLGFGYDMAFIAGVFFLTGTQKKSIIHFALAGFSWILMILYGSRGALLCTAVFAVLFVIGLNWTNIFKWVLSASILLFAGLLAFHGEALLVSIASFLQNKLNINSRTIMSILQGTLDESNGRDWIYRTTLEAIRNRPWLGYGAFGDRQFIAAHFFWGYCHNIVLEMWMDFGVVAGTAILLVIIEKTIRTFITSKTREFKNLMIVCIAALTKLIISDSFWTCDYFWILIAVIFLYGDKVRRKRKHHSVSFAERALGGKR